MTINQILVEITRKGSIFDEIMDNVLNPRIDLKPQLISEIAISYLENAEKIEKVYRDGYFKYYFINTIRNQVHSSTSPFHKNNRINQYNYIGEIMDMIDDDDIETKIEFEEKLNKINKLYKDTSKTWFEDKMWEEYYINGKTYRQIEAEYGLDHCLVFHNVKKVKEKIKKQL
jgi:hypothetical protein